jgi:hypothetical protein
VHDPRAIWRRSGEPLLARQPLSQSYLDWPLTVLTDFYHMGLLITVIPTEIVERPLPVPSVPTPASLPGAVLGRPRRRPSAVGNAVGRSIRRPRGRTRAIRSRVRNGS